MISFTGSALLSCGCDVAALFWLCFINKKKKRKKEREKKLSWCCKLTKKPYHMYQISRSRKANVLETFWFIPKFSNCHLCQHVTAICYSVYDFWVPIYFFFQIMLKLKMMLEWSVQFCDDHAVQTVLYIYIYIYIYFFFSLFWLYPVTWAESEDIRFSVAGSQYISLHVSAAAHLHLHQRRYSGLLAGMLIILLGQTICF